MQYIVRSIEDFIQRSNHIKELGSMVRIIPYSTTKYSISIINNRYNSNCILEPSQLYDTELQANQALENLAQQLALTLGKNIIIKDRKYYGKAKDTSVDLKLTG